MSDSKIFKGADFSALGLDGEYVVRGISIENVVSKVPVTSSTLGVFYVNSRYYVTQSNSDVGFYSEDEGLTWTSFTFPEIADWTSFAYGNSTYVASGGHSYSSYGCLCTSTDGVTWTRVDTTIKGSVAYVSNADASDSGIGSFVLAGHDFYNYNVAFRTSDYGSNWSDPVVISNDYAPAHRTSLVQSGWNTLVFNIEGNHNWFAYGYSYSDSWIVVTIDSDESNDYNFSGVTGYNSTIVILDRARGRTYASQENEDSFGGNHMSVPDQDLSVGSNSYLVNNNFYVLSSEESSSLYLSRSGENSVNFSLYELSDPKTVSMFTSSKVVLSSGNPSGIVLAVSSDGSEIARLIVTSSGSAISLSEKHYSEDCLSQLDEDVTQEVKDIVLGKVTTSDNGKFLRVVNGEWKASSV